MREGDATVPRFARRNTHILTPSIGEDELIQAIRDIAEKPPHSGRILLGIGDDAAVWQPSRSNRSVITSDAFVENVHFKRETMNLHDVGRRAMVANLSDIAAMGARPVLATVTLGIADPGAIEEILEIYRGIQSAASSVSCAIAGGDITRSPVLSLAITVVGEVRPSNLKTRAGARPRDIVAVTGQLGASRAGHGFPEARIHEGRWLAASAHVHAMMDISDGLSTDLLRMCRASGVGAIVENVPVAESARAAAQAAQVDPDDYALAAGEDYELLVAIAPRAFRHLATRFQARFGGELYRVGAFRAGSEYAIKTAAGEKPLAPTGWDHLRA